MDEIFAQETQKTVFSILRDRTPDDLCFALLTDTRMSETSAATAKNIGDVDGAVGFDFVVHLGDLLEGTTSKYASEYILDHELEKYRSSTQSQKLYVIPGERDGYRDEGFAGQLAYNIMTDAWWHAHTEYLNDYANLVRPGDKPYYYVDIPEKQVRLIFLFCYTTDILEADGLFEKYPVFDLPQISWLKHHALAAPEGYSLMLFSHELPKSRFATGKDPYIYKGNSTEAVLGIVQQANRKNPVAAWFAGHYYCDAHAEVGGIQFVVINSQLPQPHTLAKCSEGIYCTDREAGTVSQDLWDAVLWNPKQRTIRLYRYGAGEDRVITY